MIEIPRALAWSFRAVLRKSIVEQEPRGEWPLMLCRAGKDGLRLFAQRGDVGVCYHAAGKHAAAAIAFRATVLEQFEERSDDRVILDEVGPGKGQARWTEGAVPRVFEFETVPPETVPDLPKPPTAWSTLPSSFLHALDEAAQTTAKESVRFALARIQLRGQAGEVIASDGRQLLVQSGFTFPWQDDVLVPRVRAFGLRDLAAEATVKVGRLKQQVVICSGRWTFLLGIDSKARFPSVQEVIPRPAAITSRLRIAPEDAVFLASTLPKLPGRDDEHAPITLDLNGRTIVRSRCQDGGLTTDVELTRSTIEGQPVRLNLKRSLLRRAMLLGCTELGIVSADKPLLARNLSRLYVVMPLDKEAALPPRKDAICITSVTPPAASPPPQPRRAPMPLPNSNGHSKEDPAEGRVSPDRAPSIAELVAVAEELRNQLQDASIRVARLLAGLKQHRRQSRAVQGALHSLRQLKLDG